MRNTKKFKISVVTFVSIGTLLGFSSESALAEDPKAAKQTTRDLYRSGHFLGRGDTGIADADNEDALFYNPAGLARGKGFYKKTVLLSPKVELSRATRDLTRKIAAEDSDVVQSVRDQVGTPNHLGLQNFTGILFRRAALGAFSNSNVDLLAYKAPEDGGLEAITASADQTLGATFSLAEGFWDQSLLVGITGKYLARGRGYIHASAADVDKVKEEISDRSRFLGMGTGTGADLGVMYRAEKSRIPWSLGLTMNDVGDTNIIPEETSSLDLDVKQTVNLGFAIGTSTKSSQLKFLVDYTDALSRVETNTLRKLNLGGDLSVLSIVGATGGLRHGYPTAGLYLDLYLLRIDLVTYTEEISSRVGVRPDTRYVMQMKAGF